MATTKVQQLLARGVVIPAPETIHVADDIVVERIAPGVILHPGTRLSGATTSIGPGCEISGETPATVEDCQLSHGVELKGGFFSGATFLDGANVGSGAHIRPGTLLEEEANGAHTVGLKQTILFPFVTLGSLINFCDCFMSGGTSRKNHSEVGSSYIHFNYTPHQDKATPSLIGDVPRGVMLDQPPVFLGGQGGLVGPSRITFGCVVPAGAVHRYDALEPGMMLYPAGAAANDGPRPYDASTYRDIRRLVANNLIFIGNLRALQLWYKHVRSACVGADAFRGHAQLGAMTRLDEALSERVKRLKEFAAKLPASVAKLKATGADRWAGAQDDFARKWPDVERVLLGNDPANAGVSERDAFLGAFTKVAGKGYIAAVQGLDAASRKSGTAWLQAVVDCCAKAWQPPAT